MEITLKDQLNNFVFSIVFGLVLGIVLDLFKIVIIIFKENSNKTFLRDVLYFSFIGVLSFLFIMIINMGEIRFYILAGELLGWSIYHFTLSKMVVNKASKVIKFLKNITKKILSLLPKPKKYEFIKPKKYCKNCKDFIFSAFKKLKFH